eukprot:1151658-Pelagomonas_calceolata.AAC.1
MSQTGAGTECAGLLNPEMGNPGQHALPLVQCANRIVENSKLVWAPISIMMMPLGFHAKVVTGKA